MKVDLKLNFSQLEVLVSAFELLTSPPVNHRDTKVSRSVLDKVIVKFRKKHVDERSNQSLFSTKKTFKISLEYYEAHYLEKFLEVILTFWSTSYERAVFIKITSEINQKLA